MAILKKACYVYHHYLMSAQKRSQMGTKGLFKKGQFVGWRPRTIGKTQGINSEPRQTDNRAQSVGKLHFVHTDVSGFNHIILLKNDAI